MQLNNVDYLLNIELANVHQHQHQHHHNIIWIHFWARVSLLSFALSDTHTHTCTLFLFNCLFFFCCCRLENSHFSESTLHPLSISFSKKFILTTRRLDKIESICLDWKLTLVAQTVNKWRRNETAEHHICTAPLRFTLHCRI